MALQVAVQVTLNAVLTKTPGVSSPASPVLVNRLLQLVDGTTAGKADRMYASTLTVGASSSTDLDLNGVLTDDFAQVTSFLRVKGLYVAASAANANNVVLGAAASNQWAALLNATGTATLRPGACLLALAGAADATGWAVTAGTGDLFRVANGGAGSSVTADVVIIGASA